MPARLVTGLAVLVILDEFATTTLVWQYLNRLDRVSDTAGVVTFGGGTTSDPR